MAELPPLEVKLDVQMHEEESKKSDVELSKPSVVPEEAHDDESKSSVEVAQPPEEKEDRVIEATTSVRDLSSEDLESFPYKKLQACVKYNKRLYPQQFEVMGNAKRRRLQTALNELRKHLDEEETAEDARLEGRSLEPNMNLDAMQLALSFLDMNELMSLSSVSTWFQGACAGATQQLTLVKLWSTHVQQGDNKYFVAERTKLLQKVGELRKVAVLDGSGLKQFSLTNWDQQNFNRFACFKNLVRIKSIVFTPTFVHQFFPMIPKLKHLDYLVCRDKMKLDNLKAIIRQLRQLDSLHLRLMSDIKNNRQPMSEEFQNVVSGTLVRLPDLTELRVSCQDFKIRDYQKFLNEAASLKSLRTLDLVDAGLFRSAARGQNIRFPVSSGVRRLKMHVLRAQTLGVIGANIRECHFRIANPHIYRDPLPCANLESLTIDGEDAWPKYFVNGTFPRLKSLEIAINTFLPAGEPEPGMEYSVSECYPALESLTTKFPDPVFDFLLGSGERAVTEMCPRLKSLKILSDSKPTTVMTKKKMHEIACKVSQLESLQLGSDLKDGRRTELFGFLMSSPKPIEGLEVEPYSKMRTLEIFQPITEKMCLALASHKWPQLSLLRVRFLSTVRSRALHKLALAMPNVRALDIYPMTESALNPALTFLRTPDAFSELVEVYCTNLVTEGLKDDEVSFGLTVREKIERVVPFRSRHPNAWW
eukprot:817986_1